jgi:hypothetical protein
MVPPSPPFTQTSDSPSRQLFPWQLADSTGFEIVSQYEISDPITKVCITLPRLNGLTINEMIFVEWAIAYYKLEGNYKNIPIVDLMEVCYRFIALRLGWAEWVKDDLIFDNSLKFKGDEINIETALSIEAQDGTRKMVPVNILYLVFGFILDEFGACLGKPATNETLIKISMLQQLRELTGQKSITDSKTTTPITPDSPAEHLGNATSDMSEKPLNTKRKSNFKEETRKPVPSPS